MKTKIQEKYYLYLLVFIFLFGFCLFGFYKIKGRDSTKSPQLDLSAYNLDEGLNLNNLGLEDSSERVVEEESFLKIFFSDYFVGESDQETKERLQVFLENFPQTKKLLESNFIFEDKEGFVGYLEIKDLEYDLENEIKVLVEDYESFVTYSNY